MKTDLTDKQVAEVLDLFDKGLAIEASTPDTAETCDAVIEAQNRAFDKAKQLGWDWESDDGFYWFCLKASPGEIMREGRQLFLKWTQRPFSSGVCPHCGK